MNAAKHFLLAELAGGKRRAAEMEDLADGHDIASATLKRAKKELGVVSFREGFGDDAFWWWALRARAGLSIKGSSVIPYTHNRDPLRTFRPEFLLLKPIHIESYVNKHEGDQLQVYGVH